MKARTNIVWRGARALERLCGLRDVGIVCLRYGLSGLRGVGSQSVHVVVKLLGRVS